MIYSNLCRRDHIIKMAKLLIFGFFIIFLTSCGDILNLDEAESGAFTSDYAIPIIDSQFTMKEILESTDDRARFSVGSDGELSVIYDGDALSISATELLLPIPILFDVPLLDTINRLSLDLVPGIDVSRAIFKNNSIQFKANVIDSQAYRITITIPSLQKDGMTFTTVLEIPSGSLGEEIRTDFVPLSGWELISGLSELTVIYDARNAAGERVSIPDIRTRIDFLIFSYVEGQLSTQIFDVPAGSIPLDAFKNYISGTVEFQNPFLRLIVDNTFGVPIEPTINELNIITTDGETLPFASPLFERGVIKFDFPGLDEVGQSKRTVITLNKDNSNILELIDERSESVSFDIDAVIFPDGSEAKDGFIRDDGALNLITELILPLSGRVEDYFLFDTYPIDTLKLQGAQALTFNLGVTNGLPIGLSFQVEFLNERGDRISKLFTEPIEVKSAETDAQGQVTASVQEVFTSNYDRGMIEQVTSATAVRAIIGLRQPPGQDGYISILDSYKIDIQLGLQVKVER